MVFYDDFGEMECLAGDTLPTFEIGVELEEGETLTGYSMQLILADWGQKDTAVLCKTCTPMTEDDGFTCTLTSADTAALSGVFQMHFRMVDEDGLSQRKLAGALTVLPVPQGGGTA